MEFAQGYLGANGPELKNFDPLRFAEKSPEWLPWFREAELKHGRVAMLATLGWIGADFVKLPGDIHQVSSFAAHNVFVQSGGMIQILFWCGVIELITIPALRNMETSDRAAGEILSSTTRFSSKLKQLFSELHRRLLFRPSWSGKEKRRQAQNQRAEEWPPCHACLFRHCDSVRSWTHCFPLWVSY